MRPILSGQWLKSKLLVNVGEKKKSFSTVDLICPMSKKVIQNKRNLYGSSAQIGYRDLSSNSWNTKQVFHPTHTHLGIQYLQVM